MRLNEHTGKHHTSLTTTRGPSTNHPPFHPALSTPSLLLVPYAPHHVPTYHAWMQDPSLQTATASEPLTLDEEYAMQRAWRQDGDKLTFILCRRPTPSPPATSLQAGTDDPPERMLGDVNLFLFPFDPDTPPPTPEPDALVGELELMLARRTDRGQGHGRTALLAFTAYILAHWTELAREYQRSRVRGQGSGQAETAPALAYLRARIHETNERSMGLFESVGFARTGTGANFFGEVEVRWKGEVEDLRRCKGWEEGREVRYD